jgi:hypothetical protein
MKWANGLDNGRFDGGAGAGSNAAPLETLTQLGLDEKSDVHGFAGNRIGWQP